MSINVTVNSNPVCVKRSRMILSDVEQIKKFERDRRRRLRMEQVRQQSKEISSKVLERAKNLAKKELSKLEKDGKSELRKMHDRKIMEIQRKYQEDMEDIGLAHSAAALQPDVDVIIEVEKHNNRALATERGKEAMLRLKDSAQKEDPAAIQQERLRQVREVENIRSSMVAKLSSKVNAPKDKEKTLDSSENEENINKSLKSSPRKKKHKKLIGKKSPTKVVSKSNVKVVGQPQKSKSPRNIVVEIHQPNSKYPKKTISRGRKANDGSKGVDDSAKSNGVCKGTNEVDSTRLNSHCNRDTDDQEPRKTVPTIKLTPSKAEKVARYNPEDYKQETSDSTSTSSSSVSDDSSYFSDGCGEFLLPKTTMITPKHHTSLAPSKVQVYDHSTRQRNAYDQPMGLVERINIRNEPNAVDAAREIIEAENLASNILESRRLAAERRGNDAQLRDRVRREYDAMVKNIENMSRGERILKSSQCCTNRHIIESRRTNCQTEREFVKTSRDRSQPGTSQAENIGERITTISSHEERPTTCPDFAWKENAQFDKSVCCEKHDSAEEMSREEQIFERLKNIERQKRLLLRDFGPDLPNTILSASMTHLFDSHRSTARDQQPVVPPIPQPVVSPEIKIINMSSSDENTKKTRTIKKKTKKNTKTPPPQSKTTETAVQTSQIIETGEDKSVQVEIITEGSKTEMIQNETKSSQPLMYVEPRITVITPEVDESSSNSSISRYPGIVIELENQRVKVTPRKRKSSSEKSSKRLSSRARSKPRSLPSSVTGSPVKRSATSAPASRSGSPKKIDATSSTKRSGSPKKIDTTSSTKRSRSPDKTVDIQINKRSVQVQAGTSRPIKVPLESSIETSSVQSTPEVQEITSGKPYRILKHPTFKKVREIRDASDTSTSYASLPAPTPGAMQSGRLQITPILELLDSSTNETIRATRINISPVSTPETPSPRTMNIPSNIPHPDRVGRILTYGRTTTGEDSTMPPSSHHENSSSTDPSYSRNGERRTVSRTMTSRRSGKSSDRCSCANPTCELMHENINDIRDYATNNHPEVLEKYDDLQNVCTERIASLTALIKRVRNEQQGMEFSMISPADETSLMQIPPSRPLHSDFQSVQRLVESIEAIHSKLAKTLVESQKIIMNGNGTQPQTTSNADMLVSSLSYETKSKGSSSTSTEEAPIAAGTSKAKPKVIANEEVQIDLDKFKRGRPYTAMVATTENPPWPLPETPRRHEEMVAKLSQEILEQSKKVDNSRENNAANDDSDVSSSRRAASPQKNLTTTRRQGSPRKSNEGEVTRDERRSPPPKKDEEFVPLLAGIPKIPRTLPTLQPGTRPRPPPASGPYRSEMISPRHELSTIVEFDTPDTVNQSQGSVRSTVGKSRRLLHLPSPAKVASSSRTSEKNAQTLPIKPLPIKPSVHVAPLISQNMARTVPRKLTMRDVGSPDEKFVFPSDNDLAMSERGTIKSLLSQEPNESLDGEGASRNDDRKTNECPTDEMVERDVKEQRGDRSKFESYETNENKVALGTSTLNVDSGVGNENKNEKLTSTSSNSFSGLSGISEIGSTPTSELMKWASSSEEIETALKKMGLGWAIVTLKKTREASALSSSSNSDLTPMNTARRAKSPGKKQNNDCNMCGLPDFSDVSSISIKEASKSTERAVLMKARTSTPNIQISNSSSGKSTSATTSSSGISIQDPSDSLTAPNLSLTKR